MGGNNSNSNSSSSSSKGNNDETTNKRRLVRRRLGPNTTIPSSFRIDISLLDISNDVQSDPEASHLRNRIQQHLRTSSVYSANNLLTATDFGTRISSSSTSLSSSSPSRSDGTSTMSTADTVRHHILRFLKAQDKYTAFVSILLKNQAFHEVYHNDDDDDDDDDDRGNALDDGADSKSRAEKKEQDYDDEIGIVGNIFLERAQVMTEEFDLLFGVTSIVKQQAENDANIAPDHIGSKAAPDHVGSQNV